MNGVSDHRVRGPLRKPHFSLICVDLSLIFSDLLGGWGLNSPRGSGGVNPHPSANLWPEVNRIMENPKTKIIIFHGLVGQVDFFKILWNLGGWGNERSQDFGSGETLLGSALWGLRGRSPPHAGEFSKIFKNVLRELRYMH